MDKNTAGQGSTLKGADSLVLSAEESEFEYVLQVDNKPFPFALLGAQRPLCTCSLIQGTGAWTSAL